ncbi:hypothetical protein M422DRAFT_242985 [Sphaerobolus stellatus SS14]|nr:hypothetical protein M422DRAFT_242985 [Sphaerobolus stellatus SS14]
MPKFNFANPKSQIQTRKSKLANPKSKIQNSIWSDIQSQQTVAIAQGNRIRTSSSNIQEIHSRNL